VRREKMTVLQITISIIVALFILLYLKRSIQRRGMKEYSVFEVVEKLKDTSVVLLDVRTLEERNHSAIQGSLHIPLRELIEKLKVLEKYKQNEIICYCHSGSRSMAAVSILNKNGFNAVNMKGGISEWKFLDL
jgi:rhodanese-related sulfurtransferase